MQPTKPTTTQCCCLPSLTRGDVIDIGSITSWPYTAADLGPNTRMRSCGRVPASSMYTSLPCNGMDLMLPAHKPWPNTFLVSFLHPAREMALGVPSLQACQVLPDLWFWIHL